MARKPARPVFIGAARTRSPDGFTAAVFGACHGTPYKAIDNRVHATAPDAFRSALAADANWQENWDFDVGGRLFGNGQRIADLGNLATRPRDGKHNRKLIETTTRRILDAGAVPIMFGGDDSTPIPFIMAFAGSPPITILRRCPR